MSSKSDLETVPNFKANFDGEYDPSDSSFGANPSIFFSMSFNC